MVTNILYAFGAFIFLLLLQLLIYQGYLLRRRNLYAYLLDLKNKNPDILIQTKVKLLKKNEIRYLNAIIEDKNEKVYINEVLGELNEIKSVFKSNKDGKYYLAPNHKDDKKVDAKIIDEVLYYEYKLKDRDSTFVKSAKNLFISPEIVMYKNPFTAQYLFEYEIDGKEVLTEVELMNKIPQKLDRYFFDNMEMSKIMDFPNTKKKFNELKFFSTESAIIAALIFVGLLLF